MRRLSAGSPPASARRAPFLFCLLVFLYICMHTMIVAVTHADARALDTRPHAPSTDTCGVDTWGEGVCWGLNKAGQGNMPTPFLRDKATAPTQAKRGTAPEETNAARMAARQSEVAVDTLPARSLPSPTLILSVLLLAATLVAFRPRS
jgi:hypothetical protein